MGPVSNQRQIHGHYVHCLVPLPDSTGWFICGGPPVSSLVAAQGNAAPPVSLAGGPHVGSSVGGPPVPLSAAAWGNVALPVSSLGGVSLSVAAQGNVAPSVSLAGGPTSVCLWGVLRIFRWHQLEETMLRLSPLLAMLVSRGVPVQGVPSILAFSLPRIGSQLFHSWVVCLLPQHLPSGPTT